MTRSLIRHGLAGALTLLATVSLAAAQAPPHAETAAGVQSPASGGLHGTVRDENGQPLAGVMVTARGSVQMFSISDGEGKFAFDRLRPGGYVLSVTLKGYVPPRAAYMQVGAGEPQLWSPVLTAAADRPVVLTAGVAGGQPAGEGKSPDDRSTSEVAWRLRRIPRGVLKDTSHMLAGAADPFEESLANFRRAFGTPARLASLLADITLNGQINLLTTASFERPQDLFSMSSGTQHPVAYVSLIAPTDKGDYNMRGAITQGDISSWILAGSYARHASATHAFEAGASYSTQVYQGGNAEALTSMSDGRRNVGELYAFDTWTISPRWTVAGGGKYAGYAYLDSPALFSGRVSVGYRLTPKGSTTVNVSVAHREIAPGAEEFVAPTAGPWLPPERTFAALGAGELRPEAVDHVELSAEQKIGTTYVMNVRAFRQRVDDQIVTLFGVAVSETPATLGHYHVASGGDFETYGWGIGVTRAVGKGVKASLDYTYFDTRRTGAALDRGVLRRVSSSLLRDDERIQDLTATLNGRLALTATRLLVVYKLNSAFTAPGNMASTADARFEVQVNQELPFLDFTGAQWEMLAGVRNLFRSELFDGSVYDELLVARPPKRVVGGLTVRF